MIDGRYRGRGLTGSGQHTESGEKKTPTVVVGLALTDSHGESIGLISTFLYFSADSARYSFERLRALGWPGKGPDDLADLSGIDKNEVDVEVKSEMYLGRSTQKAQILTGGGLFTVDDSNRVAPADFAKRVKLLLGGGAGSSAPKSSGPLPPF